MEKTRYCISRCFVFSGNVEEDILGITAFHPYEGGCRKEPARETDGQSLKGCPNLLSCKFV